MLITFWTRSTLQRLRCLGTQLSPGRREAAARRDRWGSSSSTGNVAGAASEVTQTHERQHSQNPMPHGVTNRGSLPGQNVTARVCSLTLPHALCALVTRLQRCPTTKPSAAGCSLRCSSSLDAAGCPRLTHSSGSAKSGLLQNLSIFQKRNVFPPLH